MHCIYTIRRPNGTSTLLQSTSFRLETGLDCAYDYVTVRPLMGMGCVRRIHDDVIKWKHFPSHGPFLRGIHRSPMNSPHKGQWRGALVISLIWVQTNGWVNNRDAGDLRHHSVHYDVTIMQLWVVIMPAHNEHMKAVLSTTWHLDQSSVFQMLTADKIILIYGIWHDYSPMPRTSTILVNDVS